MLGDSDPSPSLRQLGREVQIGDRGKDSMQSDKYKELVSTFAQEVDAKKTDAHQRSHKRCGDGPPQ